jgi:hypothetical protein
MNNLEEEFIEYPEALELKQLGFDEPCLGFYERNQELIIQECLITDFHGDSLQCVAPTYSQAFRWFREKYKLHQNITSISQESWQWHITKPGEPLGKLYDEDFYTYEETELACLKKLIEIVKEKQI